MPDSTEAIGASMQLRLDVLAPAFSVCKLDAAGTVPAALLERTYCFVSRTPDELSIVCETAAVPADAIAREDGWRALKVAGPLDFGLVGILAKICSELAASKVPVFAVSTYDTDYVLAKAENLDTAIHALENAGFLVSR